MQRKISFLFSLHVVSKAYFGCGAETGVRPLVIFNRLAKCILCSTLLRKTNGVGSERRNNLKLFPFPYVFAKHGKRAKASSYRYQLTTHRLAYSSYKFHLFINNSWRSRDISVISHPNGLPFISFLFPRCDF